MISNGGNDATISVTNNVTRFTGADMNSITNGKEVSGVAFKGGLGGVYFVPLHHGGVTWGENPYTNYTANDLNATMAILITQAHELGRSLAWITGVHTPPPGRPSDYGGPQDVGNWFDSCVQKKYSDALITPH